MNSLCHIPFSNTQWCFQYRVVSCVCEHYRQCIASPFRVELLEENPTDMRSPSMSLGVVDILPTVMCLDLGSRVSKVKGHTKLPLKCPSNSFLTNLRNEILGPIKVSFQKEVFLIIVLKRKKGDRALLQQKGYAETAQQCWSLPWRHCFFGCSHGEGVSRLAELPFHESWCLLVSITSSYMVSWKADTHYGRQWKTKLTFWHPWPWARARLKSSWLKHSWPLWPLARTKVPTGPRTFLVFSQGWKTSHFGGSLNYIANFSLQLSSLVC